MADISIQMACENWATELTDIRELILSAAGAVLASTSAVSGAQTNPKAELSVMLGDDALVQQLNNDYRNKNKATNVLSFPTQEMPVVDLPPMLGDVILSYETVRQEARDQGKPFSDHIQHLVIHGVLHLLGYDHENNIEAQRMEAIEIQTLDKLGISNPYTPSDDVGVVHG